MTLVKVGTPVATTATSPDVAALLAQLQAAQAALAAEKARAEAAEKSKGASRGYSAKVSEKGAISISGVNSRFPVTLYAPHFVGVVLDFILTDKAVALLRENADRLSVKVGGESQAGTPAAAAEINRLADRLEAVVAKVK
jgi:hypothetical protein